MLPSQELFGPNLMVRQCPLGWYQIYWWRRLHQTLVRQVQSELRSSGLLQSEWWESLLKFWDNLTVPSSRVKNPRGALDSWTLKMEPIGGPETSVRNYHYSLPNKPEESSSHLLLGGSLNSRRSIRFTSSAVVRQVPSSTNQMPAWDKTHQAHIKYFGEAGSNRPWWGTPHQAHIKYLGEIRPIRLT